jgi:hypothetical protein
LKGSEIEDLLPSALLVQVLDRMERRAEQDFEDFYQEGKPIVPQIKAWAAGEGFDLEPDWKVRLSLNVKGKLLVGSGKHASDDLIKQWADMFKKFC